MTKIAESLAKTALTIRYFADISGSPTKMSRSNEMYMVGVETRSKISLMSTMQDMAI